MAGLGMQVTSEVVAGALLGLFVDYLRGHGHTGVIVGSLVGISVGLYSLVSQALRLNRQLDRVAPTKGRGKPIPPSDDDSDSDFPKQ